MRMEQIDSIENKNCRFVWRIIIDWGKRCIEDDENEKDVASNEISIKVRNFLCN